MSSYSPQRKIKIALSHYPYQQDIANRILMSQLSVLEVHILREILHHSLHFSVEQLAKDLDMKSEDLIPLLDKLTVTHLFKRQGMTLSVDKERRKYFEFEIEKFDENFQPGLDFFQRLLSKVPIHILPIWYAIPRSSDHIFYSIIEKCFLTPRLYRSYLAELEFDDPIIPAIIQDVYQAPHCIIPADKLRGKYHLTRERLEEYLLLLEYHFVCCLSYRRIENHWQAVITPFAEWQEYLRFEAQTKVIPLQGSIIKGYYNDFNFIQDLSTLLNHCDCQKVSLDTVKDLKASTPQERQALIDKLIQVAFVQTCSDNHILATEKGRIWLAKPLVEKISALAVDPLNTLSNALEFGSLWNIRNLHLIEKSLRRLQPNQWVGLEQFLEGFIKPIGEREAVTLKSKGKKWKYVLPHYTLQEKLFIQAVIMERLAELGIVNTGTYQGQACFSLTPLGHQLIF